MTIPKSGNHLCGEENYKQNFPMIMKLHINEDVKAVPMGAIESKDKSNLWNTKYYMVHVFPMPKKEVVNLPNSFESYLTTT